MQQDNLLSSRCNIDHRLIERKQHTLKTVSNVIHHIILQYMVFNRTISYQIQKSKNARY